MWFEFWVWRCSKLKPKSWEQNGCKISSRIEGRVQRIASANDGSQNEKNTILPNKWNNYNFYLSTSVLTFHCTYLISGRTSVGTLSAELTKQGPIFKSVTSLTCADSIYNYLQVTSYILYLSIYLNCVLFVWISCAALNMIFLIFRIWFTQ